VSGVTGVTTEVLVVAVPAAVLGAASFGLASAMQQRATKQVPTSTALDPRLIVRLVRQPTWVLGIGTVAVGFGLQVLALAYGPLVLVQPLLVTGVLFGTVFSTMLAHRPLDRQILLGASACVVGLAALLTLSHPSDVGGQLTDPAHLAPLAIVLAVIIVGCLVVAIGSRFSGAAHVAALAVATGVLYGVTAGMVKVITTQLRDGGLPEMLGHPALYVICVCGPLGFLLSQNTFQQGVLIAPALAIITLVDPLVGFAIGVFWLGERVNTSAPVLGGACAAALLVVVGIGILARRGTQIRHQIESGDSLRSGDHPANRGPRPSWG
jgi:drug/metabolite transporter (DMT)-like permease